MQFGYGRTTRFYSLTDWANDKGLTSPNQGERYHRAVYGFNMRDSTYGHLDTVGHANFDRYSLDTATTGFTDSMKYGGVVVLNQPVIDRFTSKVKQNRFHKNKPRHTKRMDVVVVRFD